MKYHFLTMLLTGVTASLMAQSHEQLLLSGWRFQRGAADGAEAVAFDDSKWAEVSIPHDWAIAGPFDKEIDKQVVAIEQNGEKIPSEKTGRSGSLPWIGEGWYRTQFTVDEGYDVAELVFDGAMAEPKVYVDGREVGYWAYGYNTFRIQLGHSLRPGTHTLAVHLKNVEESSRWYPGAGLYRPVRLLLQQDNRLDRWETFARTTRLEGISADGTSAKEASLYVTTQAIIGHDSKKLQISQSLYDAEGNLVKRYSTGLNRGRSGHQVMTLADVKLWSPEHPVLYRLVTELKDGDRVWDRQETAVGIRSISYTADGFRLNGQLRKFKGVCLHHDLGPLGAAFNKDAFRRQVRLLKEMGCDAIRTAHNMPAPWQMDICDEMGMMVMAESFDMWKSAKCKNGYARFFDKKAEGQNEPWWQRDLTNLVKVHRNHPSIVMWSIGNEIPEQGSAFGEKMTRDMQTLIHTLDETRPCTQGMDRGTSAMASGTWQATDIPGFNYRLFIYEEGLANSPKGIVLGSETASTVSSRGVYKFPVKEEHGTAYDDGQISSYDLESCIWSNLPDDDWMYQDKCPWVIGEFVWTGFDYLGEPTPYDEYWPSRSSYFGIYDLAGLPKDRVWLYRTHWLANEPTLHVLPHWTWPDRKGEVTPVFCYTNYPEAELFVNGKSQGRRRHTDVDLAEYEASRVSEPMPWGGHSLFADPSATPNRLDRYRMRWMDVTYEPGEIRVVAYDSLGKVAATEIVRTAGKPDHIELTADRTSMPVLPTDSLGRALDCPSLTFVTARIVDKDGNLCPDADAQLSFAVRGTSAKFNSCCNGDATSTEVFTQPTMRAFHGQCVIVLESTANAGAATLTVSAKGLKPGKVNVDVK